MRSGIPRHERGAAPPVHERWGYGRWLAQLRRHWNEPHFRLERVFTWLPEARALLDRLLSAGLDAKAPVHPSTGFVQMTSIGG